MSHRVAQRISEGLYSTSYVKTTSAPSSTRSLGLLSLTDTSALGSQLVSATEGENSPACKGTWGGGARRSGSLQQGAGLPAELQPRPPKDTHDPQKTHTTPQNSRIPRTIKGVRHREGLHLETHNAGEVCGGIFVIEHSEVEVVVQIGIVLVLWGRMGAGSMFEKRAGVKGPAV